MDIQLVNATTGAVIETFTDAPNAVFTRPVVVNPGVGTFTFKVQVRSRNTVSSGGSVYGALISATQGKR